VILPDRWRTGRVCVVAMSAIGDTVHTLPVLAALRRAAPTAHLTCVLQPAGASLVSGHPSLDEIAVFQRNTPLRSYRDLRRRFGTPFDLLLVLNVAFKAGVFTALTPASIKLGFDRARARDLNWLFTTHRIPPHPRQHVQDQYFEFLAALGVPAEPVTWDLGPRPSEREAQARFFSAIDKPVAVLVIGTSDPDREWLPERWAELSDVLSERFGLLPVLAGGSTPRELQAERAILARARHRPLSALGWALRDLVWLLDGAALVVSLDTGPLHMGVALNRPVIALMGSLNPKINGPYRRFGDLLVDAYGEPADAHPPSRQRRKGRMQFIQVADVVARVETWKRRYADPQRVSAARAITSPTSSTP